MPEKDKIRKRLLYDLSPIPEPPITREGGKEYEVIVRVVYRKTILVSQKRLGKGTFKVGYDKKTDAPLDESICSLSSFNLVSGKTVSLENGFTGYAVKDDRKVDLSEVGSEFEVTENNYIVVEFGDVSIVVMMTEKEKVVPAPLFQNADFSVVAILLFVFLVGGFVINMVVETPPIEVDITEIDNRFAKLIIGDDEEDVEVEEIEEKKKVKLEKPKEGIAEANTARKSLGEEGRVGDKKSRVANAQGSARRGLDEKVANSAGIMGALSSGAALVDRVFGGGGLGAGMEKTLGSVTGISGVDQFGSGGLGTRGFGSGGGGNALGIGGLGTRGRGGGGGASGYGMAGGKIGGKRRSAIRAGGGQAVIMGALDRAIIDAYIRRNLAKIRWCYEKELNKNPKLFGKIVVKFIISKTGKVSSSKVSRTTMGNQTVESCVARQIKKIRFPNPKGGGIVVVNYPFVFKNSEG